MRLLGAAVAPNSVTFAAGALMTTGLMAKTGLFPLHAWLPPPQAAAPAPASAMLSALAEKAPLYVILRLWFDVLPSVAKTDAMQFIAALGAAGILFGSLMALRQKGLKPIIAYSTVAQLGYVLLMLPLALGARQQAWADAAWSGGMYHALAHAPAKAAMFLAAGLMARTAGEDRLDGLIGAGHRFPMAAFAFGLAGVSLMGSAELRVHGQISLAPVGVLERAVVVGADGADRDRSRKRNARAVRRP